MSSYTPLYDVLLGLTNMSYNPPRFHPYASLLAADEGSLRFARPNSHIKRLLAAASLAVSASMWSADWRHRILF